MKRIITYIFLVLGCLSLISCTSSKNVKTEAKGIKIIEENLSGHEWIDNEGSYLILDKNGEFYWYKEEAVRDDNYYKGTYKVLRGKKAMDYLSKKYESFGFGYFESLAKNYKEDQFHALILYHDGFIFLSLHFMNGTTTYRRINGLIFFCFS